MFDICEVLQKAREMEASNVYLKAGLVPRVRMNTKVNEMSYRMITGDDMLECLLKITTAEQRNLLEEQGESCLAYEDALVGRYRVNVFKSRGIISMVFHAVPSVLTIENQMAALQEKVQEIAGKQRGLVLFAGNAGSGRTGSMAAVVHEINQNNPVHIITLESPIEVLQPSKLAVINQREFGTDYTDGINAVDSALKEAADVLVYDGRLEGKLILKLCQVSGAGPLVLAGVYGSTLTEVIGGITALFAPDEKDEIRKTLSEVLQAVVICKWAEEEQGIRQEWDVISVDSRIKNQIRNCI